MGQKRIIIAIAIVSLAITGMITLANFADKKNEYVVEEEPFRIFVVPWPSWAFLYVADEKGFFTKNNVDVELIPVEFGVKSKIDYNQQQTDMITIPYNDIFVMNAIFDESSIVYATDISDSGDFIIANVNSVSELKGKKIGIVEKYSFSYFFVLKVLEQNGIGKEEVTFVTIPVEKIFDSITSGYIDAGHSWIVSDRQASRNVGLHIIAQSNDVPGIITDALVVKRQTIENNPEKVESVVRSYVETTEYCKEHVQECVEIISRKIGWSEAEIIESFYSVPLLSIQDNFEMMNDKKSFHSLYSSGMFVSENLLDEKQLSKMPNFDVAIESSFVNKIIGETP